jgi:hypothetical protein
MRLAPAVSRTGWSQYLIYPCRSCPRPRQRSSRVLVMRRCWTPAIGALLLWLAIGPGCRNPAAAGSLGEWERLLHLPGDPIEAFDLAPDGTLFSATATALFRALPDRPDSWSLVAQTDRFAVLLHAVSRDRVLALVRYGDVYQWSTETGWSSVGEIPDSLVIVDGKLTWPFVRDWWIPNASEIYLAGRAGIILHYDGEVWTRVPSDGLPPLDWTQIDGDASRIVVAGPETWQRQGGAWRHLPRSGMDTLRCGPLALVVRPTDLILGGAWIAEAPCLRRFESGTWQAIGDDLRSFRDRPFGGELQADGSALIWSTGGDIARVGDSVVTLYPSPKLFGFNGAALHAGYVYFAGTMDGDGVVGRIRQP